jgi:hypothetical protein
LNAISLAQFEKQLCTGYTAEREMDNELNSSVYFRYSARGDGIFTGEQLWTPCDFSDYIWVDSG